ncbi:MAG: ATP-binding protein [Gammaproteobacteria bacterium]|nr:ATP-binding protein [Gammaproteobacteria bacterium]
MSLSQEALAQRELSDHIGDFVAAADVPSEFSVTLHVLLDELLTNIVFYGYPEEKEGLAIDVALEFTETTAILSISDNGISFDPLKVPPPDTSTPLEQRDPGGLGIHMCRKLVDDIQYERRNLRNHIRLVKDLSPGASPDHCDEVMAEQSTLA